MYRDLPQILSGGNPAFEQGVEDEEEDAVDREELVSVLLDASEAVGDDPHEALVDDELVVSKDVRPDDKLLDRVEEPLIILPEADNDDDEGEDDDEEDNVEAERLFW